MHTKDNEVSLISIKRNPYPEDYDRRRNAGRTHARPQGRGQELQRARTGGNVRQGVNMAGSRRIRDVKKRQRRQIQSIAILLGMVAFVILGVSMLVKGSRAAGSPAGTMAGGGRDAGVGSGNGPGAGIQAGIGVLSGDVSQGIPVEVFARHPEWEENFLTPNEYSRPGDELKEVRNIFVHYTANPGTSAAQNRSYFERQKDEHIASVSAHFIIGYEGEIIQCVPLTEIAYAVQTRNFDSVSIECCYKAKDGSFTKETYNSLISLLAWLTDVYDLGTEDILRHYDCGGKKCPLYYTDHEDKWEQLKDDVKKMRENIT